MNDPGILSAFVEALGWTLLHFIWQGAVIGAVYACAAYTLKGATANARYWTGMSTLAAMFAAPVLTMSVQLEVATSALGTAAAPAAEALSMIVPPSAQGFPGVVEQWVEAALPWAVLAWFVGVMILSCRLALDFVRIRRLAVKDVRPLSPGLQHAVDRLIESLKINGAVRVLESARVAVPMVVGWLRPVVLLPPSALMGLTPHQLELIISHELAHVKRLEYLFNLMQIVVETLLFYHPVVRMVSIRVRLERENCCDDVVVARTGDTLAYARALTEVEGLRCSSGMQLSLAATGGHLRGRVKRLVAAPAPQRGAVHWVAGLVLPAWSCRPRASARCPAPGWRCRSRRRPRLCIPSISRRRRLRSPSSKHAWPHRRRLP
jgi:beta-lactamase regulating signal transducer with metallopeptidase domain